MTNEYALMRVFEEAVEEHVRISRKLKKSLIRLKRSKGDEEVKRKVRNDIMRLNDIRRRILFVLGKVKEGKVQDDLVASSLLTLMEFFEEVGVNDEEVILRRALLLSRRGSLDLPEGEVKEGLQQLKKVREMTMEARRILSRD